MKQAVKVEACFMLDFCLAYFLTLKMEAIYSLETSVGCIISQKIELIITTAVRTSNPIQHFTQISHKSRSISVTLMHLLKVHERKENSHNTP
jgi:hypothetical protein